MIATSDSQLPNKEQLEIALNEIVSIAVTVDGLYYSATEKNSDHVHLAKFISSLKLSKT